MGNRQIKLSDSAFSDLGNIENYIAEDSPTVAQKFIQRIFERIEQLYDYPESGKVVDEFRNTKIRELVLKRYRIIYEIMSSNELIILRVIHGSRILDLDVD